MEKITNILEKTYNSPFLRKSSVPCFVGNPGLGKTSLIKQFVESTNQKIREYNENRNEDQPEKREIKLFTLVASTKEPFTVGGTLMPNKETKVLEIYDPEKFRQMQDGDILFLDELLNTKVPTMNALLTVIMERKLESGYELPDIMIVAAGNHEGRTPMTAQIKQRFTFYYVEINKKMFSDYFINKFSFNIKIVDDLLELCKREQFKSSEDNFITPRSLELSIIQIINGMESAFDNVLSPILKTLVTNVTDQDIELPNGGKFLKNESKPWIDLIKLIGLDN